MRKRKIAAIILICCLIPIVAVLSPLFPRVLGPSRLTVHAPPEGWRSIMLDGQRMSQAMPMVVSPIDYGPHNLRIELTNGKIVWATFFHSDTGVDRQIDIYVGYKASDNTAAFRETLTRYETFPGITRTVYTGSTKPEKTSATKPLTLDWI